MRAIVLLGLTVALMGAQAQADPPAGLGDQLTEDRGFFDNGLGYGIAIGGTGVAALIGVLYFLGVGGLRHVDANNVLEHPMRASLLETVQKEPGIHLRELAQRHETAVTNTQWHLRKLEMAQLVRTQKVAGRRLYYPTEGGVTTRQEALLNAATANENAAAIYEFIQYAAGCNQRALAEELGMNPGTVRWHLRKLEEAGLIRSVPDGVQTKYYSTARRRPRPLRAEMKAK